VATSVWSRIRGAAQGVRRRLTPPGNRTPIEESLEQKPGLSSGVPSQVGQRESQIDGWLGKG
jgi:hypothetical protein